MTIYKRLLFLFLTLTLIPMLVVGIHNYESSKKFLKHEIIKKLETIRDLKVNKIELFLKERVGDAYVLSKSQFMVQTFTSLNFFFYQKNELSFNEIRSQLDNSLGLYTKAYGYRDIMLVNMQGIVIYTLNNVHYQLESGRHLSPFFSKVFEKAKMEISFSEVYKGQDLADPFLITIAASLKNNHGDFLGEIFLEVDMHILYDLIQDRTGLGYTGETIIGKKTADGAMFLNPLLHDPDAALKKTVQKGDKKSRPLLLAVQGQTGSGIAIDYNDQKVIAAWRHYPLLKWGIVIKMNIKEAFFPVMQMLDNIALLILISFLMGSFIVFKITKSLTKPIIELTQISQKVNEGDLSARAEITRQDEIGDLARYFNSMVQKLTGVNSSLKEAQRIAHIGNWELDLSKNLLTWSDEIYRIFELIPGMVKPSGDLLLSLIHPDDREFAGLIHSDSNRLRTPYSIHYRLLFADGRIKYVEEECETIYDSRDEPARTVGIIHDMTAEKMAEIEIRKLNSELETRVKERTSELETSNKELEAFSYSVSHDLRAPLRSIIGFAELLKKRTDKFLDEKSRHYLDVISESTLRLGNLIDDILSFSRMAKTEMIESMIDFTTLTNNAIKALNNETQGREIQWIVHPMPISRGDLSMMQIVMINLISNALKFTSKCEQAVIEIGAKVADARNIYYVKDNGAGFDMSYSSKLFGLFQRLHRSEEFPGNGVGLANVHRIILRHGGQIWAEGKPGEGATFFFALPK